MHASARGAVVLLLGALVSTATILLLWPVSRGHGVVAAGVASAAGLMQLVDDRLAGRPAQLWRATRLAALTFAVAWVVGRQLAR